MDWFVNGSTLVATPLLRQIRDQEQVTRIKDQLLSAARESLPRIVVLDMCYVEFMGSAGFLACLAIRRVANVQQVVLCNLRQNVREAFAICGLIADGPRVPAPFQVADSLEQALFEHC